MEPFKISVDTHTFNETRVLLSTGFVISRPIRAHNALTAFFLNIIGKIVKVDVDGRTFYLNKNSLLKYKRKFAYGIPDEAVNRDGKEFVRHMLNSIERVAREPLITKVDIPKSIIRTKENSLSDADFIQKLSLHQLRSIRKQVPWQNKALLNQLRALIKAKKEGKIDLAFLKPHVIQFLREAVEYQSAFERLQHFDKNQQMDLQELAVALHKPSQAKLISDWILETDKAQKISKLNSLLNSIPMWTLLKENEIV